MHIPVIFEDSDIIVLNKPSGVVVHPFDFSNEGTILDFLHENYPETFSITNPITLQDGRTVNLGGIVHKLDRDTSGVLVIAKNRTSFSHLKEHFTSHTIAKTYIAIVEGVFENTTFTINAPLGRNKKDYKQSMNPINPRGKPLEAITHVRVIESNGDFSCVELTPITGRTHQLRAHMSGSGHPIVGDIAYGSTQKADRIMLHASSLTIQGKSGVQTFTVPLPSTFSCDNFLFQQS